jgi:hypothetical protein
MTTATAIYTKNLTDPNYTWWLIWIVFILLLVAPWGHGWGY